VSEIVWVTEAAFQAWQPVQQGFVLSVVGRRQSGSLQQGGTLEGREKLTPDPSMLYGGSVFSIWLRDGGRSQEDVAAGTRCAGRPSRRSLEPPPPLRAGRYEDRRPSVSGGHVHAVQKKDVKVRVEIFRTPEALHEGPRAATRATVALRTSLAAIPGVDSAEEHGQ